MRVLVTGGAGYLGSELCDQLAERGDDVVATTHRTPLDGPPSIPVDVRDRNGTMEAIRRVAPEAVFHTVKARSDWRATADGAAHVALAAKAVGARMVHVSSDAVFSGRAIHYAESAEPDPVEPYGAAKAAAEVAVRAVFVDATIVRTALILGHGGSATERLIYALESGERSGVLFTDDIRCPVHVSDLVAALCELDGRPGTFHVAGSDALSRMQIGRLVCDRDGLDATRLRAALRSTSGVPGPLEVRLECSSTQELLTTRIRGAREFLRVPVGESSA